MKVNIEMKYDFPGKEQKVEKQVINVRGKRGAIDINGNGTDKKITIVATGKVGSKKVDVTFSKKVGEKSKVKVVKCPKKQLKHF